MDLKQANADRWSKMHIPAAKGPAFKNAADKLAVHKARYQAVSDKTGVPWEVIAVIHYREAGLDRNGHPHWNTYLGNGQALNKKTTIVPKGRGPFATWEEGAMDALVNAAPKAALNKDWSIGGTLEILEKYNGLGYFSKGVPSPYIWAGTDRYASGKYVADHVYDPNHVDTQLGCAGLLKFLGYKKASVSTTGTIITTVGGGTALAVASTFDKFKDFLSDHWIALLIGAVAIGFAIDFAITMYKNRESNPSNIRDLRINPEEPGKDRKDV